METVKIGWGKREISINEPVQIPGQMHMRISEGIHDPLYVTALCVDGGEGQDAVIFCSCDVTGLNSGVIQTTRDKVAQKRPEILVEAIVMNATHTHSSCALFNTVEKSPDGQTIYPGEKFRDFFTSQCAEAICEAWDRRAEGGIAYGYGYAVVGHSRRTIYFDDVSLRQPNAVAPNGHGVMYGKTNDDQFSHYENGSDYFLNLMFTVDAQKKLTGVVVNTPCPSQTSEMFTVLSADFWNEVRENMAKEYGEDVFVLPQCAAAGDLSPRILHYRQAQERRMELKYDLPYDAKKNQSYNKAIGERRDIAERIMNAIREVYGWAKKDIQTQVTVRHTARKVPLVRRLVTDEEKVWCEENIEKMRQQIPDPETATPEEYRFAMSRFNSIKNRNNRALERYETQKEQPTVPVNVHAVQIGDIAFATNKFELYQAYMHRIQARSPFIQTFVVQLAGDEGSSYLATAQGVANKGYSASLFCNQFSPEGGQQLVEATLEMLREFAEKE